MLRVTFSPAPECVVPVCWNRAFQTPPCHQTPVVVCYHSPNRALLAKSEGVLAGIKGSVKVRQHSSLGACEKSW